MANACYPKAKELIWKGDIDLENDTIKVSIIDLADYTYNTAHDFYNDVSAGAVGTPQTLTNKTFTSGVFDADDVTFSSVTGDQSEALIIWKDTGNPATSPVLFYLDTGVAGLPVTPNGGPIVIQWNASGIAALV